MKKEEWPQFSQLNYFGLWPGNGLKGNIQRLLSAILILHSPALFAAELVYARNSFNNEDLITALEPLNEFVSGIQFFVTTLMFVLRRKDILNIVSLIDDLNQRTIAELGNPAKKEIYARKKFCLRSYKVFFWTFFVLVNSWTVPTILMFLMYDKRVYVVHSWVPFDSSSILGYVGNHIFQVPVCWFYCMGLCMFASLFVSISEQIFGHFAILQNCLQDIKFGKRNSLRKLVQCIKYQNNIFQICQKYQDLTSFTLTVNYIMTVILLCIILVNITSVNSVIKTISLLSEAQLVLLFIGTFCWYGNEITLQYSQMLRPAYMTDWYNGTEIEKKIALNLMTRSMKQFFLGGFIRIDMLTFVNILKGAFSYYNFILAVNKKNNEPSL